MNQSNKWQVKDPESDFFMKPRRWYRDGYGRKIGFIGSVVYDCLKYHANWKTKHCDPAVETISRETGLSGRSVQNGIKKLREYGIIVVTRKSDWRTKRQGGNIYILVPARKWPAAGQKITPELFGGFT